MKKYVLIYLYNKFVNGIVVINKVKSAAGNNKINLIGGEIKKEEYPIDAAHRKLKEETGFETILSRSGYIHGNDFEIFVFSGNTEEITMNKEIQASEIPYWIGTQDLLNNKDTIEELKIIVPLLNNQVHNWFLEKISNKQFTIRMT